MKKIISGILLASLVFGAGLSAENAVKEKKVKNQKTEKVTEKAAEKAAPKANEKPAEKAKAK